MCSLQVRATMKNKMVAFGMYAISLCFCVLLWVSMKLSAVELLLIGRKWMYLWHCIYS
jgi:hypothetical protein